MKKTIFLISAAVISLLFFGCGMTTDTPEVPEEKVPETPSEIEIDFSSLENYSKETGIYTSSEWKCIPLYEYKPDDYKFLEIKYSNATGPIPLRVNYTDRNEISTCVLEKGKTVSYIYLNPELKDKIGMLHFQNTNEKYTVKLESIKYVKTGGIELPEIKDTAASGTIDKSISAVDFAKKLKSGWNLGNSFDCTARVDGNFGLSTMLLWGEVMPTKEIIHAGKTAGYTTIRIPVTWHNHIIDGNYTIDPEWMGTVKQVVNWAIEDGYYVILNEHHSMFTDSFGEIKFEDFGFYLDSTDSGKIELSKKFLTSIWI